MEYLLIIKVNSCKLDNGCTFKECIRLKTTHELEYIYSTLIRTFNKTSEIKIFQQTKKLFQVVNYS